MRIIIYVKVFVQKITISAVKRVEFVSDITLRGR
jgi:hypothetical protein